MTALYMDGFDHYGVVSSTNLPSTDTRTALNMLDGNWGQVDTDGGGGKGGFMVSTPPWGAPRTGDACLAYKKQTSLTFGGATTIARRVLASTQTKLFVSFGFAIDTLPTAQWTSAIIDFRNNANTVLYSLGLNASGQLQLWNGPQTTLNAITNGPVVQTQTWHFFEMEVDLVTGAFTLRVDDPTGADTPVMSATIATTGSIAAVGFGEYLSSLGASLSMYWDDLFIRNASGSVNNDFLGDRRVATLFANSDTTTSGWTPSYYKEFGAGILKMASVSPNFPTPVNTGACVVAANATALDIGSSDFTLETFIRWDKLPASSEYSTIFNRWDSAANKRSYRFILGGSAFNNSCLQFDTSTDGLSGTIATPIVYPWAPNINQWYHIALVRASGELLLFVNGQQLGLPIADSRTYFGGGTEIFSIGAEAQGTVGTTTIVSGSGVAGRTDETRFTNGYARYTGPFTTPTAAFPRGVSDPQWAFVSLLCGYDSGILDESAYARTLTAKNGAVQYTPSDGPLVGAYSTVNKATPDDNTFIAAALVPAINTLTMTTQPTAGNTVTVGTKDGTTPAVYTFRATVPSAFDVLIDTTAQGTLINLFNAINVGAGSGTKYGTGTVVNFDVTAVQLPVGQIEVTANTAGVVGNSIPSTRTGTAASWASATLTGGADIPGPTNFKFRRPPSNTTIISALQTTIRALKTDSGLGSVQTALIGPLGGTATGTDHALVISPKYYNDIIEVDPDTSGPLTPTTIINGEFQINRTA